jgi:FkbM family methyltransferase
MLFDLNKLIKRYNLKIKGVIHVGAHYGEEDSDYNTSNIKNKIYIEASSINFKVLCENLKNQKEIILLNKAIGNFEGEIDLNIEEKNNGQSNSILRPLKHLEQYPDIKFTKKERVKMIKLNSLNLKTKYNLLNIDIQGYELEALKGANKLLDEIDVIICEINREELYENCPNYKDISNYLKQFGFKLVEKRWIGGSWGDGLYLKKDLTLIQKIRSSILNLIYSNNLIINKILSKFFK